MVDSVVCVDASVGLKLVLPEPGHDAALSQWLAWINDGVQLVSPHLFAYETTSVLRNKVARGVIGAVMAERALAELLAQRVELLHPEGLEAAAYALASDLRRPNAYDTFYLAVGRLLGCATWTADERLYRAVHRQAGWLKVIR